MSSLKDLHLIKVIVSQIFTPLKIFNQGKEQSIYVPIQNLKAKDILVFILIFDFPGFRTSRASMASTASTSSVASMTYTTSFDQKND